MRLIPFRFFGNPTKTAKQEQLAAFRAVEQVCKRIAADLHDGPAQDLAAMILRLQAAEANARKDPQSAPEEIARVRDLAQAALDELRRFISELGPSSADKIEVLQAVRSYVQSFKKQYGIEATLEVSGDLDTLPPDVQINLYRIIQEALRNVGKHSHAKTARVTITRDKRGLSAVVTDDGNGFNLKDQAFTDAPQTGMGINSMKARASALGADLHISSSPGRGTTVVFFLSAKHMGDK
ncbi:MAG: sensor histidine kinase [Armatimonadota bacterium]